MKKKLIKQVMVYCLTSAMLLTMPNAVWASATAETQQDGKAIEITEENKNSVVYEDNGLKISVAKTIYDANGSSPFNKIEFMVENNSTSDMWISMYDSYIDGFKVNTYSGNGNISGGKKGIVDFSIWEKDYTPYGITDFKIWESTFKISGGNIQTDIEIPFSANRNVFLNEKKQSPENTVYTQNSEATEDSKGNKAIDSLEKEKSELEKKVKDLESENSKLKAKIETLESENEELKDKNKKFEEQLLGQESSKNNDKNPEQEKEDADVVENTDVSVESKEGITAEMEAEQPVVEYKDVTTIRIVQQELNNLGYSCGTPDGVAGANTTKAITDYQTAKGINVNGLVTDELLQSLQIVDKVQKAVEAEASKDKYGADYGYEQLARNPEAYTGAFIKISGKILQAESVDGLNYGRVAMNSNYDTVVFVTYDNDVLGYRLLDGDIVNVYGTSMGVYSYKTVSGATITIPWIHADIIEMQ